MRGKNSLVNVDKCLFPKPICLTLFPVSRKSKNFYYLFPGQGRGARKRFVRNLVAAIIVGGLTAGLMAWIFYVIEK